MSRNAKEKDGDEKFKELLLVKRKLDSCFEEISAIEREANRPDSKVTILQHCSQLRAGLYAARDYFKQKTREYDDGK